MCLCDTKKLRGFTLIEVAIALGVMGLLSLVVAALFMRSIDTYGKTANETDTTKQARYCLEMISREMRESINNPPTVVPGISNPTAGALLGLIQDAILLTSARMIDPSTGGEIFATDAVSFEPTPSSIILFYINTTPEGLTQLVRHHLFYAEDLSAYTPPFFLAAGNPYVGNNIVIVDSAGMQVTIDQDTGSVGGVAPFRPPKILMNRTTSFDVVWPDTSIPIEIRIACQFTDPNNRSVTTRLRTQVEPRNS